MILYQAVYVAKDRVQPLRGVFTDINSALDAARYAWNNPSARVRIDAYFNCGSDGVIPAKGARTVYSEAII